ncbi:MAG: tetratricopeptide repeat protein, partial [Planctomycetes bacterium]|nr:tetratricopeptide repeat protein [Planctomycetota bacterium]
LNLAREALARNPDFVPALLAKGVFLSRVGDAPAAAAALTRAAELAPDERAEHAVQGLNLAREALARNPDFVPALLAKGVLLSRVGDAPAAAAALTRAAELAPDDSRVVLGLLGLRRGFRDAAPELAPVLADARDRYLALTAGGTPTRTRMRILVRRGQERLEASDLEGALRDFDAALRERPFDPGARFGRGVALALLEGPAAGAADWRIARAMHPELRGDRLRTFSELYERSLPGDLAALRPEIERAVDFAPGIAARAAAAPESAQGLLRAALESAIAGEPWAQVRAAVAAARAAAPDSAAVALEAARICCGRDLYPEASDAIARARALGAPAALELDRLEAELLLRRGQQTAARAAYRRLAERDPGGLEGLCAAAEGALLEGDLERAADLAQEALDRAPDHRPSLIVQSFALSVRDPSRAEFLAARARSLDRDLDTRAILALLVAHFEGIVEGTRAWMPQARLMELSATSAGASWLLVVARYAAPFGLGDPRVFARRAASQEPDRPDVHALLGALELERGSAEAILLHWERARALDPDVRFDPRDLRAFEARFPGVLEARWGRR